MIFGLFTLAVALTISAVAAYYSIAGLCAIFAAAVTPIIIMGAALELGKITATVWLHKYWHRASFQFKLYLIPAIVVLMLVTSMGIFGFLSKAHMDQSVTVGDSAAQVQILDEKIKTEQDNIASAKRALTQMDSQVDQMLSRTTDDKGTNRAVQIRKQQAGERKNLQKEITEAQKHIAELQNERAPLAAQSRKIEAEVGPIKYIAALIYGDNPDANLLERAVRWVIILLVFVFDPLALVLILAAEQTIEWARTDRKEAKKPEGWHQEWVPDSEAWPEWDGDIPPLTEEQLEKIKEESGVDQTKDSPTKLWNDRVDEKNAEEFFSRGKELARAIDANNGFIVKQHHNPADVNPINVTVELEHNPTVDPEAYALATAGGPGKIEDIPVLENEETWANRVIDENQFALTEVDADNSNKELVDSHAGFGIYFPQNPAKGDLFIRVDMLPNRLYKWNGQKWIDVDKKTTDSYAYNKDYIKFLTGKIQSGEYHMDDLEQIERDRILEKLPYHDKAKL